MRDGLQRGTVLLRLKVSGVSDSLTEGVDRGHDGAQSRASHARFAMRRGHVPRRSGFDPLPRRRHHAVRRQHVVRVDRDPRTRSRSCSTWAPACATSGMQQPHDGTFRGTCLLSHLHWDHTQGLPVLHADAVLRLAARRLRTRRRRTAAPSARCFTRRSARRCSRSGSTCSRARSTSTTSATTTSRSRTTSRSWLAADPARRPDVRLSRRVERPQRRVHQRPSAALRRIDAAPPTRRSSSPRRAIC